MCIVFNDGIFVSKLFLLTVSNSVNGEQFVQRVQGKRRKAEAHSTCTLDYVQRERVCPPGPYSDYVILMKPTLGLF